MNILASYANKDGKKGREVNKVFCFSFLLPKWKYYRSWNLESRSTTVLCLFPQDGGFSQEAKENLEKTWLCPTSSCRVTGITRKSEEEITYIFQELDSIHGAEWQVIAFKYFQCITLVSSTEKYFMGFILMQILAPSVCR